VFARCRSMRLVAALAVVFSGSAAASDLNGWRTGGTGVAAGATPPIIGASETTVRWKTATGNWGNASPVLFGSLICITEEPVSLSCFDADTGEQKWTGTNRFMDTLPASEQAKTSSILTVLENDRERRDALRVEMGMVQRELRRSTAGAETQQRYDDLMKELNAIAERKIQYAAHILSGEHGIIGYATATPTVSDGHIYGLFGNGVLSKFDEQGERKWSVWLGAPIRPMQGYHTGTSASLLMVDGVLVVPFAHMRGIDPRDGSILWKGPKYTHYGTPAVTTVDGTSVVVTPGGELISPRDGTEVGDRLAAIEFIGPVTSGNKVFVIGHTRYPDKSLGTHATAYTLHRQSNGRISSTQLWERKLMTQRIYASPIVTDDRIYLLYSPGTVEVVNPQTGAQISTFDGLPTARNGSPSMVLGGSRLLISFEVGVFQTYSDGDHPKSLGRAVLEGHRSTALLDGSRIYVRGLQHLYCIE
jgi:outer membrane protein assembly factor BamB